MVDLIIFTCQGREHLLQRSYPAFKLACDYKFDRVILAIDGKVSEQIIELINPDVVVQSPIRKGYVNNILEGIKSIKSELFFWLEDDWDFPNPLLISERLAVFEDETVIEITFAKQAPDTLLDNYQNEYYINPYGFSTNPSICRTAYIKEIFGEIINHTKSEESKSMGFETFGGIYADKKHWCSLITYFNKDAYVNHLGGLESTDREFHMVNSIGKKTFQSPANYRSGFSDKKLSLYNKLAMIVKLHLATFTLSFKVLHDRRAYDYAFRIYIAYLNKFKF